jgi:predicted nucleotidyltransferase
MRRSENATVKGLDIDALSDVFRDDSVRVAVLYGSLARGDGDARSDADIGVGFDRALSPRARTRARLALVRDLSLELGTDDVDVTPITEAPIELIRAMRRDGILLVGSVEDFEAVAGVDRDESGTQTEPDSMDELIEDMERVV